METLGLPSFAKEAGVTQYRCALYYGEGGREVGVAPHPRRLAGRRRGLTVGAVAFTVQVRLAGVRAS